MISCGITDVAKMSVSPVIALFRFGLRAGAALPPVCQDPEQTRPLCVGRDSLFDITRIFKLRFKVAMRPD